MTNKKQKPKGKSSVPSMTIQEFKIWIKGLSAFQDESWFPNKVQWEHITQLIDNLDLGQSTQHQNMPRQSQMGEMGGYVDQTAHSSVPPRFPAAPRLSVTGPERSTRLPTGEVLLEPVQQSEFA
jgi:hypothetical protein